MPDTGSFIITMLPGKCTQFLCQHKRVVARDTLQLQHCWQPYA